MTRFAVAELTGGQLPLWDADGWASLARDMIPRTHQHLSMLRVFLPFIAPSGAIVRWSTHVRVETIGAEADWWHATRTEAEGSPTVGELQPCRGELDEDTARALQDAIGGLRMTSLRWTGYAGASSVVDQRERMLRVHGNDYDRSPLNAGDLEPGRQVPEFAWDDEGRLAWGGRLYPDSIIVAAELPRFRQLRNDPRVDSVAVIPHRDVLPGSVGD